MWYHVSNIYLGKKVRLVPNIPKIADNAQSEYEGNIPRICVAPSIFQCLRAKAGYNHISSVSYEGLQTNPFVYFTESVPYIPPASTDYRSNDERWFLAVTEFYYLGMVDMYKLFTKELIEPTDNTKIRLPKELRTVYKAKENFLRKVLAK